MFGFRTKRKLTNINLTRRFHFQHMGLWICLAIALNLVANLLFYMFVEERWSRLLEAPGGITDDLVSVRHSLALVQAFEVGLFCAAVILLGKATSHRIAGPYLRLERAFREVAEGDLDHDLFFRTYDGLEDLETAFQDMMATLKATYAPEDAAEVLPEETGTGPGESAEGAGDPPLAGVPAAQQPVSEQTPNEPTAGSATPEAGQPETQQVAEDETGGPRADAGQ